MVPLRRQQAIRAGNTPVFQRGLSDFATFIDGEVVAWVCAGTSVGEGQRWVPLVETVLVVAPLEHHLQRLARVVLVNVTVVVLCGEVSKVGVGVVVRDVGSVAVVLVPDPAVELVHSVGSRFDGSACVTVSSLGVLPEDEQPLEQILAMVAVVEELALGESLGCGVGDDVDVAEVGHATTTSGWPSALRLEMGLFV